MESAIYYGVLVFGGYMVYTTFRTSSQPQPKDGNNEGINLPAPRFLYSEPRLWISAPADITYKPFNSFYGPNNDPRRAYLLNGGARVVHSGYKPVIQTNQVWAPSQGSGPSGKPGYAVHPITGIGEKQAVTSKTVFSE